MNQRDISPRMQEVIDTAREWRDEVRMARADYRNELRSELSADDFDYDSDDSDD